MQQTRIWACSVTVITYTLPDDKGRVWARPVYSPTFYLFGDVQGITSDDAASTVARGMFTALGHPEGNVYVNVSETSHYSHR